MPGTRRSRRGRLPGDRRTRTRKPRSPPLARPGSPPGALRRSLRRNSRVLRLRTRVASYPATRSIRKEGGSVTQIAVTVNGMRREDDVEPRTLLVYFLREHLGLT